MALQQIDNLIIGATRNDEVSEAVLSLNVSLTMNAVSQLTVTLTDPGLRMLDRNYFQIRRLVTYGGMKFEIASIETLAGDANEQIVIECRNRATQLLKRDKGQATFGSISPTQYAATKAAAVGLDFFGQPSAPKGEIVRTRNETSDESTWDVLRRLASDLKYELFETSGRLFFTSQTSLVGKYGAADLTMQWPGTSFAKRAAFQLYELPNCRRSDDNPLDAEVTVKVDRTNGRLLRPGMTVNLSGVPDFGGAYLVREVSWLEGDNEPISVKLQTPHNPNIRAV